VNEILIKALAVDVHIGVPDEERAQPQRIHLDITIVPRVPFDALDDDITRTVDYDAASQSIVRLAQARPRRLIETLASEISHMLIRDYPASAATVEIRKVILPNTKYVAVRHTAHAGT
jgi:dihydroneopterin aldolase